MSFYKSIAKVASLTMVSRVTGFIRDILHTLLLGAGPISDAFIIAFKLPNFFRRLFGEGAFSASFVPLFSSILTSRGKEEALQFAQQSLALLFCILLLIVGLAEIFMPEFMTLIAPGFKDNPVHFQYVVDFARLTFPYLLLISLTSLYAGVLNSFDHFGRAAAAPILLNLSMIVGLLIYKNNSLATGYALSISVTIAGFLQLFWLWAHAHKKDYKLKFCWPKLSPDTKMLLRKMAPVALSGSIFQVNLMVDTILASFLPKGSVSYLYFADRLSELPLGVIGVTIGTTLLPLLSKQIEQKNYKEAINSQNRSIEAAMILALPAAIALLMISEQIIHVLFGRGAFTHEAVIATSNALEVYAIGIPAFVLSKVFTTSFFAHKDTSTPLKIGIFTVLLNFVLNLVLMQYLQHVGLALSTSISSWVQVILCFIILKKRGWYATDTLVKKRFLGYCFCASLMGGFLYFLSPYVSSLISGHFTAKILGLMALVMGGAAIYFITGAFFAGFNYKKAKKLIKGS
ncbi:MAG: murein biosynthesis integral membrane protein MurJ [Alphaproteobacteria bacterium]|nr:murein biosynthesis integral membrane protein MurJ [Alphaproteobacteria bacterium]